MENDKKTLADLIADLILDPGFILVPQDRYEELIRAETERDVLEAALKGESKYDASTVMNAILLTRSSLISQKTEGKTLEGQDDVE